MSNPTRSTDRPGSFLQIEGDPTLWGLGPVVPENPGWTGPVSLPIVVPVKGTLVLSPARVGGLALWYPDEQNGWVPATVEAPSLYIPTATGLKEGAVGYPLAPPDNDVQALTDKLMKALKGAGSTVTVALGFVRGGVVVLNGAVLPFAVVMPAS